MSATGAFTRAATVVSRLAGRAATFVACAGLVALWAVTGPLFHFSDTWQLVINTSTTILTFLMVFLIQNTQNRDNAAVQAKLDELIRHSAAENRYIGIERLTDKELEEILQEVEHNARRRATGGTRKRKKKPAAKRANGANSKTKKAAPARKARKSA